MTNKHTILIIEDEKNIGNYMEAIVTSNQYKAIRARNGMSGISLCVSHHPDLILLDLGLPDIDGMDVLKKLREFSTVPVIVISARTQEREKVEALDAGADDYITKPFRLGELFSRIQALLRRTGIQKREGRAGLSHGDIFIDLEGNRAWLAGRKLELTGVEFRLLCLMVRSAGRVVTRDMILEELWDGRGRFVDDNTLSVYIRRLREKIEEDPSSPGHLVTIRGLGYCWE